MRRVVQVARERFGGLDHLVANAGGHGFSAVGRTDDAEWAASLHANLTTAFVSVRKCLPELSETRGSIVIVSSIAGLAAGPDTAGYTTAKHALLGLTRSIARDYGPVGIRATCAPGWTKTPMADGEMRNWRRPQATPRSTMPTTMSPGTCRYAGRHTSTRSRRSPDSYSRRRRRMSPAQ